MSDLRGSTNSTQQLGGISHGGSAVIERGGELGCFAEVVLLVLGRLVDNTCEHMEQHSKVFTVKQLRPCVTHTSSNYKRLCLKVILLYVGFPE